jgi:hypothetical protein
MRVSFLASVCGLLLLLMAVGSPQKVSAAGKFDGTYSGKLECYRVEEMGAPIVVVTPVFGTEVRSKSKMTISDNKVIDQSGLFAEKISISNDAVNFQANVPKLGPHSIDGKFLIIDGEKSIKFETGGESGDDTACEFYLTWSGAATGQVASANIKQAPKQAASKATSKPTIVAAPATQSASAAGKFDGEWKGEMNCNVESFYNSKELTLGISNGRVTKFMWNGGENNKIKSDGSLENVGTLKATVIFNDAGEEEDFTVQGMYKNQLLKLDWEVAYQDNSFISYEQCNAKLTRKNNAQLIQAWEASNKTRSKQVASKQSERVSKAEAERQRLQQEIAALKKQNEEARLLVEAERIRQEEAKKLAEIERIRKEKETRRLAEAKRKAEVKRVAQIERKRKAEARRLADAEQKRKAESKRLADVERKRNEEAKRLVEAERKRKAEAKRLAEVERKRKAKAKRVAALEKKRKSEEAKKRKASQQTASTAGGGGKLEQQLSVLKRLRANGLINDQQFETKQQALLDRFLGLGSAPSTKVARVAKPKNTELKKSLAKYSDVKFGNYHALVIGSNNYKYLPKLKTARSDAKAVAKTLKSKYGYKVNTLFNATRIDILDAFDEYREILTKDDNLLIYYAGHGYLDEEDNRGYWMPVDARPNRRSAWLSNADITGTLKALKAKHVMVMADSCYSGTLTRGLSLKKRSPDYVREVAKKKARVVITSGGLEPVADKSGGNHSPFASVFLDVLNSNNGVLDGTKLFNKMRRPVMLKADQTPAYSDVRKAGHEGGDFLFVRRR